MGQESSKVGTTGRCLNGLAEANLYAVGAGRALLYHAAMPIIHDSAVALRRLDYSESSQIVVFFTRAHGQVRGMARGIKRSTKTRFAVGIDLLDIGMLSVSSRGERPVGLATVTEWKQTRSLAGLREKLERVHAAQYAAEITTRLTHEWDPHPELFEALVEYLCTLASGRGSLGTVVRFQLDLLHSIGSPPRFDACIACSTAQSITCFSSHEGGVICRNCEGGFHEKRELSPQTLAVLRGEASTPTEGPFVLLNYHLSHLMGRASLLGAKLVPEERRRRIR